MESELKDSIAPGVLSPEAPLLSQTHLDHLKASAISLEVIKERGYKTVFGKTELARLDFMSKQQRPIGILVPLHGVDGRPLSPQFRSDCPRVNTQGKAVKYESVEGSSNHLDCPQRCRPMLGNPDIPLLITEGAKKANAIATAAGCAVTLIGVWGWKGKNEWGATTFLADHDFIALKGRLVYLAFDSDVLLKGLSTGRSLSQGYW